MNLHQLILTLYSNLSSVAHNHGQFQIMESQWRHELDEILDCIDENIKKNYKTSGRV